MFELSLKILVGAYFLVLAGLAVFGAHRYVVLWLFHRHRARRRDRPSDRFDTLPVVTVQLPLFNEMYVARRLIDAACAIDYPRDRLEIQVLDDSTDETRAIVDDAAAWWRGRGADIRVVRRVSREGYKAGALAHGLATARGEFVAIFDADFVPGADFLRRTIHRFTDPNIALVQARWTYLNEDYSLLTRLQALFLDGHFVLEHSARNWSGRWFNFNGTAGIWRRAAIDEAGGWRHDTLTEDLDLSYRSQMAGRSFCYLLDVEAPSELPVLMSSFRTQQHRWAKGSIQTARKILPALWRGRAPLAVKIEATMHLCANLAYPLVAALCVLSGPSLVARIHMGWRSAAWLDFALFFLVTASIGVFFVESRRQIGRSAAEALLLLPALLALGMGMTVNNLAAVWEGLRGRPSAFVRTPKHRIVRRGDAIGRAYGAVIDKKLIAEIALLAWFIPPIIYAAHNRVWASLPFQFLFVAGFGYVVVMTIAQRLAPILPHRGRVAEESAS